MPFLAIVTVVIPMMVLTSISNNHKFILRINYSSLPIEAGRSNPIGREKHLGICFMQYPYMRNIVTALGI
jgi:hypothetical protein